MIVLRHRPVGVHAHDFAEKSVEALRLHASLENRTFAERDEKRAVTSEDEPPAEMRRGIQ